MFIIYYHYFVTAFLLYEVALDLQALASRSPHPLGGVELAVPKREPVRRPPRLASPRYKCALGSSQAFAFGGGLRWLGAQEPSA